jgi:hypothetical protein
MLAWRPDLFLDELTASFDIIGLCGMFWKDVVIRQPAWARRESYERQARPLRSGIALALRPQRPDGIHARRAQRRHQTGDDAEKQNREYRHTD